MTGPALRLLGLDPGLRRTGWGVVDQLGTRLVHVASGVLTPDTGADLAWRLARLAEALDAVIARYAPAGAAVERTFVNRNGESTLKLGMARGVVLAAPARAGLDVAEYAPNAIKKAVVGTGRADKDQVRGMVNRLLNITVDGKLDVSDALAVAITHAHQGASMRAWAPEPKSAGTSAAPEAWRAGARRVVAR